MTNRWHRGSVRTGAMCFLALLAACTPEPTRVPEDHGGPPAGSYHEREIAAGEVHVDRWKLEPERFVRGTVIEGDVHVVIEAAAPDGRVLTRVDGSAGTGMDETFAFLTGGAGEYRLEIRPKGETGGRYDLDLVELRPARRGDEERVAAWRAFQAARHEAELKGLGDPAVVAAFRDVLALFEAVGDASGEAAALQQIGWNQARPADELEYYEEGLERLDGGGEPALRGGLLADAATAWGELGKLDRAVERYREVAELWRSLPGRNRDLTATQVNLGLTLQGLGRPSDARDVLEDALRAHRQQGGQVAGEARILVGLGLVEKDLGNSLAAIDHLKAARKRVEVEGDRRYAALALLYMAAPRWRLGDLQGAWRLLREAEEELSEIGLPPQDERRLQQERAQLWLQLGDPARAQEPAERAVVLARNSGRPGVLAGALLVLAYVHLVADAETAGQHFEDALAASRESSQPDMIAQSRLGVAQALRRTGRLDEARRELVALHRERGRHGRFDLRLFGLIEQAQVELDREDLMAAERAVDAAGRMVAGYELPGPEAHVHRVRARLERARGDRLAALREIREALALHEEVRGRVDSSDLRALALARWLESYDLETELLLELGRHKEALASAERSRARSLVELLEWAEEGRQIAPGLSHQLLMVTDRYNRLNSELIEALGEARSPVRLAAINRELQQAQEELEVLEHERLTPPLVSEPFDLPRLRGRLRDGEALLEYHLGTERASLFVITPDRLSVHPLRATPQELEAQVDKLRQQLKDRNPRGRAGLARSGHRLYRELIGPAEARLEESDARHLVIVPDGNLVYLPWEVLRTDGGWEDTEGYLLSRWAVSYAPSASVWGTLADQRERDPDSGDVELAAFAYPAGGPGEGEELAQVRKEVTAIAAHYPPQQGKRVLVGEEATEAAFLRDPETRRARVIHVAGHGEINERQPAFSGLRLGPSPDGGDDGLVQMHEIFGLGELSAELVVLSACETGLGREIRGEGLIGLSRAFFVAGTPLLTASLWRVADDSTARLMTDFHRLMRRGQAPVEALRQAKLQLAADRKFSHPYFWAPFVMIGHAELPATEPMEEP